jgi:hypothetical protein
VGEVRFSSYPGSFEGRSVVINPTERKRSFLWFLVVQQICVAISLRPLPHYEVITSVHMFRAEDLLQCSAGSIRTGSEPHNDKWDLFPPTLFPLAESAVPRGREPCRGC